MDGAYARGGAQCEFGVGAWKFKMRHPTLEVIKKGVGTGQIHRALLIEDSRVSRALKVRTPSLEGGRRM